MNCSFHRNSTEITDVIGNERAERNRNTEFIFGFAYSLLNLECFRENILRLGAAGNNLFEIIFS